MNRRYFFGAALAAAATARRAVSANDKVNVAMVGVGGRGRGLMGNFAKLPDAHISYLVDVDQASLERATKRLDPLQKEKPTYVSDMRRALDDKSVDAIVVATPDHWHGPATILGCDAGKHVYVEKPASHNVREGRLMVQAARHNKRIVQVGTQSRSRPSSIRGIEYARSGKIGKIIGAKAWDVQLRDDIGHKPDGPVPPGADYDTWLGPAPWIPFNENRFHYKWHWHWHFGTGDAGNDGAHQLDMARWGLGVSYPSRVSGMGGKHFFNDDQQTPDTMNVTFTYPDGKFLIWDLRIWAPYGMADQGNGVAIYGSEGMVHIGRWEGVWGFKVHDSKGKLVSFDNENEVDNHQQNFIDSIKSGNLPSADIGIGHLSGIHCHLANIVARSGVNFDFDAETETILSEPAANAYIKRRYRPHWATPKGV